MSSGSGSHAPVPLSTEASGSDSASSLPSVDVLVATYESAATLAEALGSVRAFVPIHHLIVVDRSSRDGSADIAREHGAKVFEDQTGLGRARNLALVTADTDPVLFVDSDVVIERPDFYARALEEYARPRTAAVVGMNLGHRFRYGLPLGLTMIGRRWSLDAGIPDDAQGRETYYLQRAAHHQRLSTRYVPDAMRHHGTYRASLHWPEFQGAAIRRSSGWNPRELAYAAEVVLLMHLNSRRVRNVAYSPVFYLKLLRGFSNPRRWSRLDRSSDPVRPVPTRP
ncbi:MAG TPA: glycosyltransferase family 2 protein [Thermoplasmata archaeon]|nr:glycosyltransferase family 2 protein [Thermoplasmata archaeon]